MSVNNFAYGLSTRIAIKASADLLVNHLDVEFANPNCPSNWTSANFLALDKFSPSGPALKRCHKRNENEFLWDYIATDDQQGIYLVAESEKATGSRDAESFPLRHDFEKLLYVFAPLHLMLCKARDVRDADRIAKILTEYGEGCCANFPSGSAFILYCRVFEGNNVSYSWQAQGDPQPMARGCVAFGGL